LGPGIITIGLWDSTLVVEAANKPQIGDVHLGGNSTDDYKKILQSITFQYSNDAVEYDEVTDTFKIPIRFGSNTMRNGASRYLEFGYSFNDALEGKDKQIVISPQGQETATINQLDKNREFAFRLSVKTTIGGTANAVIHLQAHKIQPEDWIAVRMESAREKNRTNPRPAWKSTRILEYKEFGPALNAKLLEAMKKKAFDNIASGC